MSFYFSSLFKESSYLAKQTRNNSLASYYLGKDRSKRLVFLYISNANIAYYSTASFNNYSYTCELPTKNCEFFILSNLGLFPSLAAYTIFNKKTQYILLAKTEHARIFTRHLYFSKKFII